MRLPWTRRRVESDDPYWDAFINRRPADPNNLVMHSFKQVEPGGVNPVKTEVHSPNVMSEHVKELAQFYGADLVGIVQLDPSGRSAIVSALRTEHDTQKAAGIGGPPPALTALSAPHPLPTAL